MQRTSPGVEPTAVVRPVDGELWLPEDGEALTADEPLEDDAEELLEEEELPDVDETLPTPPTLARPPTACSWRPTCLQKNRAKASHACIRARACHACTNEHTV